MHQSTSESTPRARWVRLQGAPLAGVCAGLGRSFNISPNTLRLLWLLLVLVFGTGLLVYLILAMVLPREDQLIRYQERKILGVCRRLSMSQQLDLGLVRLAAVFVGLASFGTAVLAYVAIYLFLPGESYLGERRRKEVPGQI